MKVKAIANANLALTKYWGKRDPLLILPQTSSISITLDKLYTEVDAEFGDDIDGRVYYLNNAICDDSRVYEFIDSTLIRIRKSDYGYIIHSTNHVPTASGFASSSSAFCALAGAIVASCNKNFSYARVSAVARRGSGSACRSVYPGFVEWRTGDNISSRAYKLKAPKDFRFKIIGVTMDASPKSLSSRKGMNIVVSSPYYREWIKRCEIDNREMKKAIAKADFSVLGTIAERNAEAMNALNEKCGFSYLSKKTKDALKEIKKIREEGYECYYTFDAGNNFFVLCPEEKAQTISEMIKCRIDCQRVDIFGFGHGLIIEKEG